MRNILSQTLLQYTGNREFGISTGDLGFNALEPLRDAMGDRFINVGVAEQNMVSVAAGLSRAGLQPWAYSIAPFIYGRPFEQIRNDVCMHDLPVKLIGNGGGYAYGVMGATHHAIEDYGTLLGLQNMHVFVPAFALDIPATIEKLVDFPHPAYLRLGRCEKPKDYQLAPYAPWRLLLKGGGATMVVVGPLAGGILETLRRLDESIRPSLWLLTELPIPADSIPADVLSDLRRSGHLFVVEEHVAHGGVGQMLVHRLLTMGELPKQFTHRYALGYISGFYGSQAFHRKESGLDAEAIALECIRCMPVK